MQVRISVAKRSMRRERVPPILRAAHGALAIAARAEHRERGPLHPESEADERGLGEAHSFTLCLRAQAAQRRMKKCTSTEYRCASAAPHISHFSEPSLKRNIRSTGARLLGPERSARSARGQGARRARRAQEALLRPAPPSRERRTRAARRCRRAI